MYRTSLKRELNTEYKCRWSLVNGFAVMEKPILRLPLIFFIAMTAFERLNISSSSFIHFIDLVYGIYQRCSLPRLKRLVWRADLAEFLVFNREFPGHTAKHRNAHRIYI